LAHITLFQKAFLGKLKHHDQAREALKKLSGEGCDIALLVVALAQYSTEEKPFEDRRVNFASARKEIAEMLRICNELEAAVERSSRLASLQPLVGSLEAKVPLRPALIFWKLGLESMNVHVERLADARSAPRNTAFIAMAVAVVKKSTGRVADREIAAILECTWEAIHGENRDFDSDMVRKNYERLLDGPGLMANGVHMAVDVLPQQFNGVPGIGDLRSALIDACR
jgi:hypothetical protein